MPEDNELVELRRKVAYYEREIPMGKGNCYHKFNEQGICIRCHEDAEEWDAGCVEELAEELHGVCTVEFVRSLKRLIGIARSHQQGNEAHYMTVARSYLAKIEKVAKGIDLSEQWQEGDYDANVDSGSVDTDAPDATAAAISL